MKKLRAIALAVMIVSLVGCNVLTKKLGLDNTIEISGTIGLSSSILAGHAVWVGLLKSAPLAPSSVSSWIKYQQTTIAPGSTTTFSFRSITPGNYIVGAFYDVDDDADFDSGEPSGGYPMPNGSILYSFSDSFSGVNISIAPVTLTDAQSVQADSLALSIGYSAGDSDAQVTSDLTLPGKGDNGSTITWMSTNEIIISSTGKVTRPASLSSVTLYAMVSKGSSTSTRAYDLSVLPATLTNAQAVAIDLGAIEPIFSAGDTAAGITGSISLPANGANGTTIAWSTSNQAVISAAGVVTRPAAKTDVTLTATVMKGGVSDTKPFVLTVLSATLSDAEAVKAAKGALAIGFGVGGASGDATGVVGNLVLATTGINATAVSWETTDPAIITAGGVVSRPAANATVILTATITKGAAKETKLFPLTVLKGTLSDAEAVAADKAALRIMYAAGDSQNGVTQDLILATSGANASTISWSDPSGIVSPTGAVTRPAATTSVNLTATITKGDAIDTKVFLQVTVIKAQLSDAQAVAADAVALAIGYSGSDIPSSVTSNLSLPTIGDNGSAIAWSSSDASIVSASGAVTRADVTTDITLVATIAKGASSVDVSFVVTVLMSPSQMTDAEAVAADTLALVLGFSGSDNDLCVTGNLTLPAAGASGSTITWSSSEPTVVGTTGIVARPVSTTIVTLTASIAKNGVSETKLFNLTVLLALPSTPSGLAAGTATGGSLAVSWTPAAGAERYEVYRNGSSRYNDVNVGFTDDFDTTPGLASGTTYSYQIRAINAAGSSALSAAVTGTTLKVVPPNFAPVSTTTTSVTLSWTGVKGAASYMLQRSATQAGPYSNCSASPITATTYTDSPLTSGTTYWYKLIATYPAGDSDPSTALSCSTVVVGTVEIPTFNPAGGTFTSAQTVAISCATPDATIYYTTSGLNPDKDSPVYSAATPISIAATTTLKAFASKSGMTSSAINSAVYTINLVPNAPTITATPHATQKTVAIAITAPASGPAPTSYNIYRGTSSGGQGTTPIATGITAASWTDASILPAGPNTYYYKVSGVNAAGEGALSAEKVATGAVPPTPILASNITASAIVLARNCDAYSLYNGSGSLFSITSVNATGVTVERTDSGVTTAVYSGPGIVNYYRDDGPFESAETITWKARNYNGWGNSAYSNIVSFTFPANLAASQSLNVSVAASGTPKAVTLTWTQVPGADAYYIYRSQSLSAATWTGIGNVTGGAVVTKTLTPASGTGYYYAVVAVSSGTSPQKAGIMKKSASAYNN